MCLSIQLFYMCLPRHERRAMLTAVTWTFAWPGQRFMWLLQCPLLPAASCRRILMWMCLHVESGLCCRDDLGGGIGSMTTRLGASKLNMPRSWRQLSVLHSLIIFNLLAFFAVCSQVLDVLDCFGVGTLQRTLQRTLQSAAKTRTEYSAAYGCQHKVYATTVMQMQQQTYIWYHTNLSLHIALVTPCWLSESKGMTNAT